MGLPVVTTVSGGLPVVDVTALSFKTGLPVDEATSGRGLPVTKVAAGKAGLPVYWVTGGAAAGGPAATFNGTNSSQVTISNGGRTATLNAAVSDVGARSAATKTSGKYYFEFTCGTLHGASCGIITSIGAFSEVMSSATNCTMAIDSNGNIFSNDAGTGKTIGPYVAADVVCFAIDLTGRLGWCRKGAGNWNGTAGADPATGTGGVILKPTLAFAPFVVFSGSVQTGDSFTINCGQVAFVQTAPAGFGNWPAS
jgi:hypothetical protein